MKKTSLGIFALALMMSAAFFGKAAPVATLETSAQSADFDCNYGLPDKSDPFLANTYGATKIVTYTESEATQAGLPSGFSGDVLSVEHTAINRGIMLDFSDQKIPTKLIESITFRVYIGNDDNPTDAYPELRIPEPLQNGGWVMRYPFMALTNSWQEVVLTEGNGSFFPHSGKNADFNMLSKDGYLYKFELSMRHNGSTAAFYIDSVKIDYIDDNEAPVLTYHGEDVVTVSRGATLDFDVSAVDNVDGEVDVQYVWGNSSQMDENGNPIEGEHTLTFIAKDSFGNTAEKTITVIVVAPDETPPTLEIPVESVCAKVGARVMLTFTASDDRGKADITAKWSDGALDGQNRLTQGTHTLTVIATDMSGNSAQKVITFIVTEEGDTADVVIDEEALCSIPVEPESSEETTSSEAPESSEEILSSDAPESSEKPVSSEAPESSEELVSSEAPEESKLESSQQKQSQEENSLGQSKSGCGSALACASGFPLLLLGACTLLKRKKK